MTTQELYLLSATQKEEIESSISTVTAAAQELGLTSVPTQAALTGKSAGGYLLIATNERVWWDGATVTTRAPMTASRAEVQTVAAAVGNLALAALNLRPQSAGPQFANGSRWTWAAASPLPGGVVDGGRVLAAQGGGYWVREVPLGVWHADWYAERCAAEFAGDWGACISAISSLFSDSGDAFHMSPKEYATSSTMRFPKPTTFYCAGATVTPTWKGAGVTHIGLDLTPTAPFVGDLLVNPATYTGTLPAVVNSTSVTSGLNSGVSGYGVRVSNAYWPKLELGPIMYFERGFILRASGAVAAGRDVGLTYGQFRLSRLLNLSNIYYDHEPNNVAAPLNYITENSFFGGSFTGAGVRHVHIPSVTGVVVDSTRFYSPSFEGAPAKIFDIDGCESIRVIAGRLEISPAQSGGVLFAMGSSQACRIELNGLASDAGYLGMVTETGRWNEFLDVKWPLGRARRFDGRLTLARKFDGAVSPMLNWKPEDLGVERVYGVIRAANGAPYALDMKAERRWEVTTIADAPIPAGFLTIANAPDDLNMDFEFDLALVQSGSHSSIDAGWLANVNFDVFPQPVPGLYKRDIYRIRRSMGRYHVIGHVRP